MTKENASTNLGPCPLCGRDMIDGPSVERHHPMPKSRGGHETVALHAVCHRMLHKVFSEKELETFALEFKKLRAHPDMAKFVAWVAKKPPEFCDPPRTKGRRPYHRSR